MPLGLTLTFSLILMLLLSMLIKHSIQKKNVEIYSIPLYGSLIFGYISWITVYMANLHPFVEPIIKV